jgi:hypothetical protein
LYPVEPGQFVDAHTDPLIHADCTLPEPARRGPTAGWSTAEVNTIRVASTRCPTLPRPLGFRLRAATVVAATLLAGPTPAAATPTWSGLLGARTAAPDARQVQPQLVA